MEYFFSAMEGLEWDFPLKSTVVLFVLLCVQLFVSADLAYCQAGGMGFGYIETLKSVAGAIDGNFFKLIALFGGYFWPLFTMTAIAFFNRRAKKAREKKVHSVLDY